MYTMPEGRKAPEDDLIVRNLAPEDPIMKDVDDFMIVLDDLFAGCQGGLREKKEVLGGIYDDIKLYQKDWWPPKHHPVHIPDGKLENLPGINTMQPVIWKNYYGKGRVFGCSIGHGIDTYRRLNYVTRSRARGAEMGGDRRGHPGKAQSAQAPTASMNGPIIITTETEASARF